MPIRIFTIAVWFSILLCGSALGERPFPKPQGLVNDFANVIPPEYERQIDAVTAELLGKTDVPVVVVTMTEIGGAEYNEYANRLYSAWGIGQKGEDKGVLIFLALRERKMRIETGYGVEGILPDGLVGEIRDRYMLPFLKKDKFGEGVLNGTVAIAQVIAKDAGVNLTGQVPIQEPKRRTSSRAYFFPILILFFLLISLISRGRRGGCSWIFFLPLLMGAGSRRGGNFGGSFGGFGGGFGGFGGGMSGGGGAGGSF
jgi:uncharacterized protein